MENQEQAPAQESTPTENLQLSLQDLNAVANIIKISAKRGAFEANEMSVVGPIYDRLALFLTKANPPEAAPTETPAA